MLICGGHSICVCVCVVVESGKVLLGICPWPANQILFSLLLILSRFVEDSEKQAAGVFIYSRAIGHWTHLHTLKLLRELQRNGKQGSEFLLFVHESVLQTLFHCTKLIYFNTLLKYLCVVYKNSAFDHLKINNWRKIFDKSQVLQNTASFLVVFVCVSSMLVASLSLSLSVCLSISLWRPLWLPSRQTSSLGSSTSTCSVRLAPCTASLTTHSPTSTCPILNPAPYRRTPRSETSQSAGKKLTHTNTHAHTEMLQLLEAVLLNYNLLNCLCVKYCEIQSTNQGDL